jgi:hypothetical protein
MQGDAALSEDVRRHYLPGTGLAGSANLLVMPSLDAANIAFNLLKITGGQGVTVGPILLGAAKPVHILTPNATSRRIVNMTAVAVAGHGEVGRGPRAVGRGRRQPAVLHGLGLDLGNGIGRRRCPRHSGWIPASLATLAHLTISFSRKALNCSGEPCPGSMPASCSVCRTSGSARMRTTSAFSLATTALGVPAGASRPPQVLVS